MTDQFVRKVVNAPWSVHGYFLAGQPRLRLLWLPATTWKSGLVKGNRGGRRTSWNGAEMKVG